MTSYRSVRALVTGASGFIGRWVTRALLAEGAFVGATTRDRKHLDGESAVRCRVFLADLANPGELAGVIAEFKPSIVFNLAGYGVSRTERDEILARHINMHVVGEAIAAIEQEIGDDWGGARFVQAGSALEYGAIQEPLDENAQPLPATTYGQTKLAATTILQHARDEDQFPSVTARLFTVFGPGEREGRLFPTLVAARKTADRIPLSTGAQSRDWVYVEDAASALLKLGLVPAARLMSGLHPFDAPAINLASGNLTSVKEFVLEAAKIMGIPEKRLGFGDVPQLADEMFHGPVPVARLQAALNWLPPHDATSGVERAVRVIGG